jgi:hypothetical protein
METVERMHMVAPCGIDCGICELYICKDNPQLYDYLLARGIPAGKLPCKGCRDVEGNCPVLGEQCLTYKCIKEHEVDFCYECGNFPCNKLHPAADRADILPHNLKVYNLCKIKHAGLESFISQSPGIKQHYYKGIMSVGEGPQLQ